MAKPTNKQYQAYEILADKITRYLVFGGAAGGGKSWLGCEWLLQCCEQAPRTRWFIGRNNLKDTRQSVMITWTKVCKEHGYTAYTSNDHGIKFNNGSEIVFLDLTFYPFKDPRFTRFGSMEFTGGWIEEAGQVHYLAFDILKSRIGRHMNAEYGIKAKLLITCNPSKNWLYYDFYRPAKQGTLELNKEFITSTSEDNRYLTEEYKAGLDDIKDEATKARLKEGNWEFDGDPTKLIGYEAILDLFSNTHVHQGDKWLTADIAMQGSDHFVIGAWRGYALVDLIRIQKSDGKQVVDEINDMKNRHGIMNSKIIYDSDGVGSFVGGFFPNAISFVNNAAPKKVGSEKENYENLKTQCYYHLARKTNKGEVYIPCIPEGPMRERVIKEFEQIKSRDSDKDGKIKMVRKEQVKKVLGSSPDITDVCAMRMLPDLVVNIKNDYVGSSSF